MFIVVLLLYNLLLCLTFPAILIFYIYRVVRGKDTWLSFSQKFGLYFFCSSIKKYDLWFHAASVGEVKSLGFILEQFTSKSILITTTTIKSKEIVDGYRKANITHRFLPVDFPLFYLLFMWKNRVKTIIIAESEIWPNFYFLLGILQKKVILFNARVSLSSQQKWQKFGSILKGILKSCKCIIAQSKSSYAFLSNFHPNVQYFGDLKLLNLNGVKKHNEKIASFCSSGRPILCVASTHEGEDVHIIKALSCFKKYGIIYVSRHPHRVHDIAKILDECNITHEMYSKFENRNTECLLVDEIGILVNCLASSEVVIFGGSFLPHLKGHNLMEAAQFGCKIITGKFVETFAEIIDDMRKEEGIIQCDCNDIKNVIALVESNDNLGKNAKIFIDKIKPRKEEILAYIGAML